MSKLPEDIKLAVEGLNLLEEKFLSPLRRLKDVVQVCLESETRIAEAQKKFQRIQEEIAEAQRQAHTQAERQASRLKTTTDQLALVQAQWVQEETAYKQKIANAERGFAELESAIALRSNRRDEITSQIETDTKRLEELRERIRRAQTMEP